MQAKDNQKLDEVLNCTPSTPIDFSAHEIDKIGTRLLPEDILCLPQNPVVLHSNGNGNCLFNSVSIALIGNDSLSRILREATALKLVEDKHLFANHPALAAAAKVLQQSDEFLFPFTLGSSSQMVFDDTKDRYQAIEAEAARLNKNKEWGSMLAIFGLAEVTKRPIYSIYPNVNYNKRGLFNQIIIPSEDTLDEPIFILWSTVNYLDTETFQPDHFVPVVQLK